MRKIERSIIATVDKLIDRRDSTTHTHTLSKRDSIECIANCVAVVKLWDTNIAAITEYRVMITSGGYRTATTKSRLNAILCNYTRVYIVQQEYAWYLVNMDNGTKIPFADNTIIDRLGYWHK